MSSRIAVIAINAVEPRVVADFWCAVLGWRVVEEDDDGVSIAASDGSWPSMDIVPVPEVKAVQEPAAPGSVCRRRDHGRRT